MRVETIPESLRNAEQTFPAHPWWVRPSLRRPTLVLIALIPLLTPLFSPNDDGLFIYPYCAATQLLSAWFCWQASRRYPEEKIRWQTVMLAQSVHAVAYAVTTLRNLNWIPFSKGAWFANACIAVCWVLFLPALMGIRSVRGERVRTLDYVLAALTAALMMQAMGSGILPSEGNSRVMVIMLTIVFVAAAAFVAKFASTQQGLKRFSTVMVMYLSACLVTYFVLDVVFRSWMPNLNVIWSDLLIALPELLLCEAVMDSERATVSENTQLDPALVDSLQPSIMALGGVLLALYGLRTHAVLAACAVVVLVLCYAVRTHFFYQRLFVTQKHLRSQASLMQNLATRDALTSVGNRRWFDEEIGKLLVAGRTYPCSLLLVDTDNFKDINDNFGHPLGDEVLQAVAAALAEVTAQVKRGCCARIGGDEFGALWPATNAEQAVILAEAIRLRVEAMNFSAPIRSTVSLGVATAREALAPMKLMRWADGALYQAKAAGRNMTRSIDLAKLPGESATALGEPADTGVLPG